MVKINLKLFSKFYINFKILKIKIFSFIFENLLYVKFRVPSCIIEYSTFESAVFIGRGLFFPKHS